MYAFDLSFDPHDPLFDAPGLAGVRFGVQVFTTDNVYGLDPDATRWEPVAGGGRLVVDGLSWAGQQKRSAGRVRVTLTVEDGSTTFAVAAEHAEPIKSVKLLLHGLPESALGAGWWQATSRPGAKRHPAPFDPLRWRYPWPDDDPWPEWETPWACAGSSPLDPAEGAAPTGPWICVSVRDREVRPKRLFVSRPPWAEGDIVEVICEDDASRWGPTFAAPPVRVTLADGPDGVRRDVAGHLAFIEDAYDLPRWGARADVPAWFGDVRLVLNLHGQHWTGYVFNTFASMAETLRAVTNHIDGYRVMAYLPGWEGRYYHAYPDYEPSADLGGRDGFARLVEVAHGLGVHVMPMFGMHGVNVTRYPDWERAAFRTRTDRMPTLVNKPDWDGDRAGEDDQVFCNPGEPGFRAHLLGQVTRVIDQFGVDGVFLDTSACWFNDPRHNLVAGYRALLDALHAAHPEVLVAGEGWFDALLGLFGVNQSWHGTDHTMVFPELLTRYARAVGHLSVGAPGWGSTGVHEGGYYLPVGTGRASAGHIASLPIVDGTLADRAEIVARICAEAAGTAPPS